MPGLTAYSRDLPYSYALGLFPAAELMSKRPERARRLLVHSKAADSEGLDRLRALCRQYSVREEAADRVLARVSGKENCFAAVVFEKFADELSPECDHICLHNPADKGNLGTILRTALGFGYRDAAIIRPAADAFDPHVIRASMGALFGLRLRYYDDFASYRAAFPRHALYPFMLCGATPLEQAAQNKKTPCALIFGNEGAGLPPAFAQCGQAVRIPHGDAIDSLNLSVAAGIGMYVFRGS